MKDKVSVVTGAGSGIGKATALLMAANGAAVMCADIKEEKAAQTASEIVGVGGRAISAGIDVTSEEQVSDMMGRTMSKFGQLDILFNNAGVGPPGEVTTYSTEDWELTINVNLRGVFYGTKHAIPEMLKSGGGAIVNMSSEAGVYGAPGISAYCASKGGVVMFTKSTAVEWASRGIRINCVCPGVIRTPFLDPMLPAEEKERQDSWKRLGAAHPIGRVGHVNEVAEAVLFLASEKASFIIGAILPIDGGILAGSPSLF